MNILVISHYSAKHEGNYIPSLLDLENYLNSKNKNEIGGGRIIFAFPKDAINCTWSNKFQTIEFLEDPYKNKYLRNKDVSKEIEYIVLKYNINLIHTNFDGYDISSSKVCKKFDIPFVISFHNQILKQKNILKNIYQNLMLQIHYRYHTRKAMIIFVNNDLLFLKKKLGIKKCCCINNGLSFNRITSKDIFLKDAKLIKAFFIGGSRLKVKGVDILCDYMKNNKDLNVIINLYCNDEIKEYVKQYNDNRIIFHDVYENINDVIKENDCFVSLSRNETFQYAIAESVYAGLPVVKSDCEGTNWANSIKTVKVVKTHEQFKKAILNLSNYKQEELKEASQYIESHYGNQIWCKKIVGVYKKMIESGD